MNQDKTTAIVLKRTNYGEADRIVQLITPLGRRSVMARGVRREKSKLAGGIELLSESDVVIRRGKGNLEILVSARMKKQYHTILSDYDRMVFAYEMLRIVTQGSDNVDEAHWYDLTAQTLEALSQLNLPLTLVKAWFYINFAKLSGYELSLWRDVEGKIIDSDSNYTYDVAERGLRNSAKGNLSAEHIKILRLLSTKSLTVLAKVGGMQDYLPEVSLVAHSHAAVD